MSGTPNGKARLASVIIPCFNQLDFIRDCISMILRYTRKPWELIVVNNGCVLAAGVQKTGRRAGLEVRLSSITQFTHFVVTNSNVPFALVLRHALVTVLQLTLICTHLWNGLVADARGEDEDTARTLKLKHIAVLEKQSALHIANDGVRTASNEVDQRRALLGVATAERTRTQIQLDNAKKANSPHLTSYRLKNHLSLAKEAAAKEDIAAAEASSSVARAQAREAELELTVANLDEKLVSEPKTKTAVEMAEAELKLAEAKLATAESQQAFVAASAKASAANITVAKAYVEVAKENLKNAKSRAAR